MPLIRKDKFHKARWLATKTERVVSAPFQLLSHKFNRALYQSFDGAAKSTGIVFNAYEKG